MKIKELERVTALDRATIRYYEQEGLITPLRSENGYRTYSKEDEESLLKIKLLRRLGMSLDHIRKLQEGSMDFSTALSSQIRVLESKINQTVRSRDICIEMQSEVTDYRELDARVYLERLEQPAGTATPVKPFQERVPREYHPVRRYVARLLDYTFINSILTFLAVFVLRIRPYSNVMSWLILFASYILAMPANALWLCKLGTTPGKWLMGLRLESSDGVLLTFNEAYYRELTVFRYGMGWGIPLWIIWRQYKCYRFYCDNINTDWDENCEYIYRPWQVRRKCLFAVAAAFIIGINVLTGTDSVKPMHRAGELTLAEFSENYNFYIELLLNNPSDYMYLDRNGLHDRNSTDGIVINIDGTPENKDCNFEYELTGGYIKSIKYTNHWTDVILIEPPGTHCIIAAVTMLMSQPEADIDEVNAFVEQLQEKLSTQKGSLSNDCLEIRWEYTLEGCKLYGEYIMPMDDAKKTSADIYFEIITK